MTIRRKNNTLEFYQDGGVLVFVSTKLACIALTRHLASILSNVPQLKARYSSSVFRYYYFPRSKFNNSIVSTAKSMPARQALFERLMQTDDVATQQVQNRTSKQSSDGK